MTDSTRRDRQIESIHSMQLPIRLHDRIKEFADANNMSVSEVLSGAMESFLSDSAPLPQAKPQTRRVTYWADPELRAAFITKVRKTSDKAGRRVTQHEIVEQILEDIL